MPSAISTSETIDSWHQRGLCPGGRRQRRPNWHEVKRRIDKLNQQRNDRIEQLDDLLIEQLLEQRVVPDVDARLNTRDPRQHD